MTMTTATSDLLIRAELWSNELKETLKDNLYATGWVDVLDGFPDGDTFTIPSVGDAQVEDYAEDDAVTYRPLDTGEWQFSITEYLQSGTYVTKKNLQDSFYMDRVASEFVPKQNRAIMERFETDVLQRPEALYTANQQVQSTVHTIACPAKPLVARLVLLTSRMHGGHSRKPTSRLKTLLLLLTPRSSMR